MTSANPTSTFHIKRGWNGRAHENLRTTRNATNASNGFFGSMNSPITIGDLWFARQRRRAHSDRRRRCGDHLKIKRISMDAIVAAIILIIFFIIIIIISKTVVFCRRLLRFRFQPPALSPPPPPSPTLSRPICTAHPFTHIHYTGDTQSTAQTMTFAAEAPTFRCQYHDDRRLEQPVAMANWRAGHARIRATGTFNVQ